MYRVMVIDDEPTARKLLIKSIAWEDYDMEIVGEASNGIEAINVIDDMKPDIAFVDISMPFMDGIKFTEIASERYPNLLIIILTAFDEFESARKCLRLSVLDYLLKPIVTDEVVKALLCAKKKIEENPEKYHVESEDNYTMENSSMSQIVSYLDSNYTDSTINLASVAQKFGFNTSYMSRKFKQDIGKSFVEYLSDKRMQKAMELAKANKKMFCTAEEVGIPDPNYFGRCFKKYTGVSYSDYVNGQRPD